MTAWLSKLKNYFKYPANPFSVLRFEPIEGKLIYLRRIRSTDIDGSALSSDIIVTMITRSYSLLRKLASQLFFLDKSKVIKVDIIPVEQYQSSGNNLTWKVKRNIVKAFCGRDMSWVTHPQDIDNRFDEMLLRYDADIRCVVAPFNDKYIEWLRRFVEYHAKHDAGFNHCVLLDLSRLKKLNLDMVVDTLDLTGVPVFILVK